MMKKRRTRILLGFLALPVLAFYPLHADVAAAEVRLAQSSTTTTPEQPAPETSQQTQEPVIQETKEPEPPARPACLDQFESTVGDANILFNWSSSDLRRQEAETIDRIADYAKSCPDARFRLDGHTDPSGSRRYNQAFSEQRVNTVIRELEARGVDPSRLSPATGHGEAEPKESNLSRAGRQANRRVEIIMTE